MAKEQEDPAERNAVITAVSRRIIDAAIGDPDNLRRLRNAAKSLKRGNAPYQADYDAGAAIALAAQATAAGIADVLLPRQKAATDTAGTATGGPIAPNVTVETCDPPPAAEAQVA